MRRERFDKMNVVPFIDIVLVLLVIILATATFVANKTIKINLPSSSSQKKEDTKYSILTIDKNGDYTFNAEPLSIEKIKEKLATLNPQKEKVSLHTDKETPFHFFVEIIDFMKSKGFENISIVTKQS